MYCSSQALTSKQVRRLSIGCLLCQIMWCMRMQLSINTLPCKHTWAGNQTGKQACEHRSKRTHILTRTLNCTDTDTHALTHLLPTVSTQTHVRSRTQACTNGCTHACKHTDVHSRSHAFTPTRAHTHVRALHARTHATNQSLIEKYHISTSMWDRVCFDIASERIPWTGRRVERWESRAEDSKARDESIRYNIESPRI